MSLSALKKNTAECRIEGRGSNHNTGVTVKSSVHCLIVQKSREGLDTASEQSHDERQISHQRNFATEEHSLWCLHPVDERNADLVAAVVLLTLIARARTVGLVADILEKRVQLVRCNVKITRCVHQMASTTCPESCV